MLAITPKKRAQLLQAENERLAKTADKSGDFELAKFHYQIANAEGKDLARMVQLAKPKGTTAKTTARKEFLISKRAELGAGNVEWFMVKVLRNHADEVKKLWGDDDAETIIATMTSFAKNHLKGF